MAQDDLESRKRLTFAQAQGIDPLPKPLLKHEMPQSLRVKLWEPLYRLMSGSQTFNGVQHVLTRPWDVIVYSYAVDREGIFGDEFPSNAGKSIAHVKTRFINGSYKDIYNFIQFVLFSDGIPDILAPYIADILKSELSAYRVIDGNVLAAVGSEEDVRTITTAIETASKFGAAGARSHIRKAVLALNESDYAGSVRHSISAVESISKVIEPDADLGRALAKLETSTKLHGGVKKAFGALYGYASNHEGIRHSLLFGEHPDVDETDALFMIGACSSFVTYLISKAQSAGISISQK